MRSGAYLVAACMLVSCSGSKAPADESVTKSDFAPGGKLVTKSDFETAGLRWPLTVESGQIGCDGNAYWFQSADGTKYGLNGFASNDAGYAAIEPIWSVDEKMMSELRAAGVNDGVVLRVNIGDMIREAEKACSS